MNVRAVRMEGDRVPERRRVVGDVVEEVDQRVPARIGEHRRAGSRRHDPPAASRSGDLSQRDAQDLPAAVAQQAEPFDRDVQGFGGRPVDGRGQRDVDLGQAQVAPRQLVAKLARPPGSPLPSWVPSKPVRAISSRMVVASRPEVRASSELIQSIGTVPIEDRDSASSGCRSDGRHVVDERL